MEISPLGAGADKAAQAPPEETAKSKREKPSKSATEQLWVPLRAEKTAPKPPYLESLLRPKPEEPSQKTETATTATVSEERARTHFLPKQEADNRAAILASPEPNNNSVRLPSPEAAWASVGLKYDLETPAALAGVLERPRETPAVEMHLPLEEGAVHELRFHEIEAQEAQSAEQSPNQVPERQIELPPAELAVEVPPERDSQTDPPRAASGRGGGVPPRPPRSFDLPPPSPEPLPESHPSGPEPSDNETRPETADSAPARDWNKQMVAEHQRRLEYAVPVAEAAPMPVATETRIVQHDRSGEGLAILVGFWDWRRSRRLRRELRRGQAGQNKDIKVLRQQQQETVTQLNRQQQEQQKLQARLREQIQILIHGPKKKPAVRLEQMEATKGDMGNSGVVLAPLERLAKRQEKDRPPKLLAQILAQKVVEQAIELPPEHHLTHSTWHTIEVDKAGKAVEQPVFRYGKEFHRETSREARRVDMPTAQATGRLLLQAVSQPASAVSYNPSSARQVPLLAPLADRQVPQQSNSQPVTPKQQAKLPALLVAVIIVLFVIACVLIIR